MVDIRQIGSVSGLGGGGAPVAPSMTTMLTGSQMLSSFVTVRAGLGVPVWPVAHASAIGGVSTKPGPELTLTTILNGCSAPLHRPRSLPLPVVASCVRSTLIL